MSNAASPSVPSLDDVVTKGAEATTSLWLSYAFVLFYLLVAAAAVSHRDLLVENPVKLPFLSVDLPLKSFFRVGPLLFLIAHAYVLLHLAILANRIRLTAAVAAGQVPVNLFLELLIGSGAPPLVGGLVAVIAWVSLIVGPVLLLVFFQLQFLAYHDEWTTWIQRILVLADLALVWSLWPRIVWRGTSGRPNRLKLSWWPFYGASAAIVALVLGVATFPGEWMQDRVPSFPMRGILVAGQIDPATSRPVSVWMNRLVLPGVDLGDRKTYDTSAKLLNAPPITVLRGRHLEGAVLIDAVLPRTDFSNAHLEGAEFTRAKMQGSWFDNAVMIGAVLDQASLQGASMFQARLQGASLFQADLQGAALAGAALGSTKLESAKLQGVSMAGADLRGVSLRSADLRGANLAEARLQRSSLRGARLDGASFLKAYLWHTDFRDLPASSPLPRGVGPQSGSVTPPCMGLTAEQCRPADDFDHLHRLIELFVTDDAQREAMLMRIRLSLGPDQPVEDEQLVDWSSEFLQPDRAMSALDEAQLAQLWKDIACSAGGAPFVLAGFLETRGDDKALRFASDSGAMRDLMIGLNDDKCAGKTVLSEATKMTVIELANAAPVPREQMAVNR